MRMFPILFNYRASEQLKALGAVDPYACVGIPWEMIEPHEAQAHKNHQQTLKRLAERGGLSHREALAVLEDRPYPWSPGDEVRDNQKLCRMIAAWVDEQRAADPLNLREPPAVA
jgi:hypothetical protein